ncbi:YncE family protein [Methylomonas sp. HW2-6]|uniref:YncE family protein n=1 Tax=Methylomonas sp. HW2-6 TaxID=3376687 RepID=UPI004040F80B
MLGSIRRATVRGLCFVILLPANAQSGFTLFESGQVRPLALSPDGKLLFALNKPDNRLELFRVGDRSAVPLGSVQVGLEPVALAVRNDKEIWVVNHLSDSVSIVNLDENGSGRVTRTLLVGDEPRDIVFAGPGKSRAFVTTGDVDKNDLSLLLASKNTAAAIGDPKDLDYDGTITAQDARKLISLCSLERCALN